jgi:hypothetical protein
MGIVVIIPEQIIQWPSSLWKKSASTRIKKILTEEDVEPGFFDLEGRWHTITIGRCICIGIEGERWTCSLESVERDRYPVGEPDERGYQDYKMKNPRPLRCFDIPYPFILRTAQSDWLCDNHEGGIVAWNEKTGDELDMRVIKRSVFHKTYEPA